MFTEYERSKSEGFPFYLGYHFASLQVVNSVDEFRQRIENGMPVEYGEVHLSTTIARDNGTFGFSFISFIRFTKDFDKFVANGMAESKRIQKSENLFCEYSETENGIVYYSVLRGVSFSATIQPYRKGDSIPILAFGETFLENGARKLPHGVQVHHSLVDGQHVGEYFKLFQHYLNT
ncbi:chloramphenicol acetyltransferase [Planctomycetales bacterium]|nr:chloramphenicol acetyltransferase [Planctomycetales bacterium]GHT38546.1 chloramphenicol acetyltransferase [Planctomycetales bacterium]